MPIKTVVSKGLPVKVKEATSPKVTPVPITKETIAQKQEKIQRKRKDKFQKATTSVMTGKDIKVVGQVNKEVPFDLIKFLFKIIIIVFRSRDILFI